MATKKTEKVVHKVYTARHAAGSSKTKNRTFGRCLCGAYLEGLDAVTEHKLLEAAPTVKAG